MSQGGRKTKYEQKVKTREELLAIIGPRPRKQTVVMCHGAFDIVHPGHLRHLTYAKEKGDILIGSVTSDSHISKANYRPFVPEALRALNLAAIEVVDYVMIDPNPTPLETLAILQPEYYAKGFEYQHGGMHPKTREELDVIESYGGEILFTPGDVIYSSSSIIEGFPPQIRNEKLWVLMQSEGVTFDSLREAMKEFQNLRVHVVGDTIVDSYTYCSMIGGMTKTPTMSVRFEESRSFAGGAAVVAKHLRKAGAQVTFSSVLGDDHWRHFVEEDLKKEGIDCNFIIDKTRPTTNKNAIVCNGYRLLKVDTLDNRPISDRILGSLSKSIAEAAADVVVFSDFRHGVFSRQTAPTLIEAIPSNCIRIADSQVASRWGNILEFKGFDIITPNEREARFALGDQDSVVRPLAHELYRQARCKLLLLKMGERGLLTYRADSTISQAFFTVDSFVDHLVDAVGSGDALLAYASLSYAVTRNRFSRASVIASVLGSLAAAVACEQEGNVPVNPADVIKKIDLAAKAADL